MACVVPSSSVEVWRSSSSNMYEEQKLVKHDFQNQNPNPPEGLIFSGHQIQATEPRTARAPLTFSPP